MGPGRDIIFYLIKYYAGIEFYWDPEALIIIILSIIIIIILIIMIININFSSYHYCKGRSGGGVGKMLAFLHSLSRIGGRLSSRFV